VIFGKKNGCCIKKQAVDSQRARAKNFHTVSKFHCPPIFERLPGSADHSPHGNARSEHPGLNGMKDLNLSRIQRLRNEACVARGESPRANSILIESQGVRVIGGNGNVGGPMSKRTRVNRRPTKMWVAPIWSPGPPTSGRTSQNHVKVIRESRCKTGQSDPKALSQGTQAVSNPTCRPIFKKRDLPASADHRPTETGGPPVQHTLNGRKT